MRYVRFTFLAVCMVLPGRMWSQTTDRPATVASAPCKLVYVADFDLEAENYKGDTSLVSKLPEINVPRPHIIRKKKETPSERAQDIVNLMSNSLVKDLNKNGYTAKRLQPNEPEPTSGWVVRGVFTEVQEGNRMHRAVIGFGSGADKMEVHASAADASNSQQPLYSVNTGKKSGKMPGAAITLSPIVFGAKFVMEKNAPERTVKSAAAQISKELVQHLKTSDATCSK